MNYCQPIAAKRQPLWWQLKGLQQTASGYGSKLTSEWVVKLAGDKRWRRVYLVQWSNLGTGYILRHGKAEYLEGFTLDHLPNEVQQ